MFAIQRITRFSIVFLYAMGMSYLGFAQAAENGDDNSCESSLSAGSPKSSTGRLNEKRTLARVRLLNRLESVGTKWMSWQLDGHRLLLAATDSANVLRVFEPFQVSEPIYSGRWVSEGQSKPFTRGGWVMAAPGAPMILTGDERGNLLTLEPFRYPDPAARFQGSHVRVEPNVVRSKSGEWLAAMGFADLSRVRIVPVGRWHAFQDISVHGRPLSMAWHSNPTGELLLAVVSDTVLEVFRIGEQNTLIYSSPIAGSQIQPRWIVDEVGESVLVVMALDSSVHLFFPESQNPPIVSRSGAAVEPESLQRAGSNVLLAQNRDILRARIFSVREKRIQFVRTLSPNVDPSDAYFALPGSDHHIILVGTRIMDGKKSIVFFDPADLDSPIISFSLDSSAEIVRGYEELAVDTDRHSLAVRTDAKIYVFDVTSRR